MTGNIFKSVLTAAALAIGTLAGMPVTANAGNDFGIYIDTPHHSIYFGSDTLRGRYFHRSHDRKQRRCGPRKALRKAWRMGVDKPHIVRVNRKVIAVVGRNYGHRTKIVFKRGSPHCRVVKARGFHHY